MTKEEQKELEKKYRLKTVEGRMEYAMDFFMARGFTKEAAAGIVGNLVAESSINPKRHQDGGGIGRGIAQWGVNDRWQTYLKYARNRETSPWDFTLQLRFIIHEMPSQMGEAANTIKTMTDPQAAAKLFMDRYERPGDPNWNKRQYHTSRAIRIIETRPESKNLAVVNDRGPIMRQEVKVDKNLLDSAVQFYNKLMPDVVQDINDDVISKARQFFDTLFPGPKDTTAQESQPKIIDREELKPQ